MPGLNISVTVSGFRELDELLRRLPKEVAGPLMVGGLTEVGKVIQRAAQDNVNSRTGRTARDIRYETVVEPERAAGAVAVGGTHEGKTGRAHTLRWLELGTSASKKGPIKGGATDRRLTRKVARTLGRIGDPATRAAFLRAIRTGQITRRRALKLPGNIFRASAKHVGMRPEAPLSRALADNLDRVARVFADTVLAGIITLARQVNPRVRA
jgi:hypothetical protein